MAVNNDFNSCSSYVTDSNSFQFQNAPVFTPTIPITAFTNPQMQIFATASPSIDSNFNVKHANDFCQGSNQDKSILSPPNLTTIIPSNTSAVFISKYGKFPTEKITKWFLVFRS